jgi:pimeloyl-ACP methyl ester carboxylesterase
MPSIHSLPRTRSTRETLLCLHCSGGTGRQWRALTGPMEPYFDLLLPDLLGYAEPGSWSPGARLSLDDETERLRPLLAGAREPVHVLGHSYGGAVALQMALRWPGSVASLTLYEPVRFALLFGAIEPTDEAATIVAARNQIMATADRFALAVRSGRPEEAAAMFADYWGGAGTWSAMDPRRRRNQAALMPKVFAEFHALLSDRVPASAYAALTMPVRLLDGTGSPSPARIVVRQLADRLPRATTVTMVGLDHMGPIKAVEQVRRHLPPWLQLAETNPRHDRRVELAAA